MNQHQIGYEYYQVISKLTANVKRLKTEDKINRAQYLDALSILSNPMFNNVAHQALNSILDGSCYYDN